MIDFAKAAEKGLTGFTLFKTSQGWQASTRWGDSNGWRVHISQNPHKAVQDALAWADFADGSDLV
jgi:hypothetical protein